MVTLFDGDPWKMSAERLKTTMTISKAISLITNKYSCEMVERHVRALNRIANNYKSGIPLRNLSELCQLLATCSERLPRFPEYEEPLCRIVALCGLPFLKEKSSDENTYIPSVIETLSLLGGLAKLESDPLRCQVAQAVASFYTAESNQALLEGLQVTKVTYNSALVERSAVAHSIAEALTRTKDDQTKLAIMKTLQILSTASTNCNHILAAKVCRSICTTLSLHDPSHEWVCPANNQSLLLGVLVDLCESPKAIPHVVAWRGSEDNRSCWSLLASLWRQDEKDMGVPREELGTLAGTVQPLVGAEQEACGVPPIPSHRPSAAVIDITENMRAKIYILCCKMGFQYMSDDLSEEDKITLCIIRNYLDFKSAEVWYEVAGELAQEGLRPVTPDQETLQEVLHSHEEKAEQTLRLQSELIEEQSKCDREEEKLYYEKIQQLHHMEEKSRADFESFLNRTSNHKSLEEAKQRQLATIDASRGSSVGIGDRFHAVGQPGLNVTAYCGRHISIATTPMKLLTSGEAPPPSPPHTHLHPPSPTTTIAVSQH